MFAVTFTSLWIKTLRAPFCPGFSRAKCRQPRMTGGPGTRLVGSQDKIRQWWESPSKTVLRLQVKHNFYCRSFVYVLEISSYLEN